MLRRMIATSLDHPRTRRSACAVAEALFAGEDGPPPASRLDWLADEVVDLLHHAGTQARLMFQLCLFAISWLAPLWVRALPPLRRLPLAERVRALSRMEDNPTFAPLILACKAVLCMLYYEDEEAARSIAAYDPCTPGRRRLPLLPPEPLALVLTPPVTPTVHLDRGGAA
jgi:hypothetical protein